MKRVLISAAVAAAVALPAVIGLWGNASFSQAVPVRAPAAGQVVAPSPTPGSTAGTVDDNGGDTPRDQRTEPGDDRDAQGGTATPAPSPSATAPGADDNGGEVPRDQRVEPGDDRDTSGSSGSGSSGGDDHGGHGSDD
jgi:hypothetical protein